MTYEIDDDVVISGVGGFFAKSYNIEDFKRNLFSNESMLEGRWREGERGVTNLIGKVPDIEHFDTSYFGIHREQCNFMDPMQRLVLERTFEAIIDAGMNPTEIRGKRVAVYAGSTVGENDNLFYESIISGFGITGHSRSMMPNRVSYWLNLKGPSCTYDANWLNGAEVLQAGYESIKAGHCDSAIIATANLSLNSELSWIFNDMGLLAPDAKTRAFDANANGYARSDGIVVMYLQRASVARRVYATIEGVKCVYNGNRDGPIRDVDPKAMTSFIQDFYETCKVDPRDVSYVECYGAALHNLDKAELDAIDKVYCKNRKEPLLIGSVKTNCGHAEASAITTSLAKVLVSMESGKIPANLHYENPNPNIPGLVAGRLQVVTENKEWNGNYAAINGIGLTSSYGHVLLKANPKIKKIEFDEIPRLVCASTRTDQGIQDIITTLKSHGKPDPEYVCIVQDTFKKTIPGHLYRGFAILDGSEEVKSEFEYYPGSKRQTWFVYAGMGSQWCKMGKDLMALPIFVKSIQKCQKALDHLNVDLVEILTGEDEKMFDNILNAFVGIASIQVALTDILQALGIVPDGIIGHSVGELGCAYADGCLTAEEMVLSAYYRGKASLEADLIQGMMAAVGMGYNQIKDQIPETIDVACRNGPDSCTLSGPKEDMEKYVKELQDKGVFARLVNVADISYHSRYTQPAGPILIKYLRDILKLAPKLRSPKWISTSAPEEIWDTDVAKYSSAEYQTNNMLCPVLFEEGCKHIPKESIVIEIAPHGLLQAILKRSLKANCTNIPVTHKTAKNQLQFFLNAIGKLYVAGLELNLPILYPKVEYPVSRGTKSLTTLVHWEHGEKWRAGLEDKLNYMASVLDFEICLAEENFRDFIGNQINNTVVVPISAYLQYLVNIMSNIKQSSVIDVVIEKFKIKEVVPVPKIGPVRLYVMIQKGSGDFEISSGSKLIATGNIKVPDVEKLFAPVSKIEVTEDCQQLTGSDIYGELQHRGHKQGGVYKTIKNLNITDEGSVGTVRWDNSWDHLVEAMLQQTIFHKGERNQNSVMISSIQKIAFSFPLLPTEPTDVEVTYDYSTQIIGTEAIQITGINVEPLELSNKPISFDALEFLPLSNKEYPNIEIGINLGVYLTLENFEKREIDSLMVFEVQTKNAMLKDNITKVLSKYSQLNANISVVQSATEILISQTQRLLVIVNDFITEDLIKLLLASHAFMLVKTNNNILNANVTEVSRFTVGGTSYSLLRTASKVPPIIVQIKGDTLTSKDLAKDNLAWVTSLKSTVANNTNKRIYLASNVLPFEGIRNFVQEIRAQRSLQNVRIVFILDKKLPEFATTEATYQKIFKDDLNLVVIKDGQLGTIVPIPTDVKENIGDSVQTTSNVISNTRIDYLGVNVRDETLILQGDPKAELGSLDYSGVTGSNQKVMGLAHVNLEFCKLVPDPVLCWNYPPRWSLEDAATVPHAYALAYYALVIIGRTKPSETVLVHGGCSAVGLAAISIAYTIGCTVFITVTNDKQKAFMKKQYRFLGERNIFNACNTSFEPHLLMATGGQGAHVILNCLTGSMLGATLRCIAEFGKLLQLGQQDIEENNEIGMRMFLKNVSLVSVCIDDILCAPTEVKQQIRDLLQEGIQNITVRPLHRNIVEHQDIKTILKQLKQPEHIGKLLIKLRDSLALNNFNIRRPLQYICDPKSSYLVYGGSADMWTDVLEWLVFRGARKIIVSSESKAQQAHINRRLTLLQSYFNAEIIYAPTKAQTRDSAAELLSEVYFLGPIGAVFVLPSKSSCKHSDIKAVQYLDAALKTTAPKALLINFLSSAAGICQLRSDAGFPTQNVQWESSLEFFDALNGLDNVLKFKARDIVIKDEQMKDDVQESSQSLYNKLSLLLPTSVEQVKEEVALATKEPDFFQLATLCGRVVREIPPVFVIPGMFGRKAVGELASQLFYPVYCATFPITSMSLQKTAEILAEKMKLTYPRGPYNIVGISSGGVLAIEVCKILEKKNEKTQLQLIDGAPDTIQAILKHMGDDVHKETNYVCRMLNLTNPELVKNLTGLPNWNARVKHALYQYGCSEEDEEKLIGEVLTTYKNYLDEIIAYQPSQELVNGNISLLRPVGVNDHDVIGLPKYCRQKPEIALVDGDHRTILKERVAVTFINNKIMC